MKSLPVIAREFARLDAERAISAHIIEAGRDVALGFIDALEDACEPNRTPRPGQADGETSTMQVGPLL